MDEYVSSTLGSGNTRVSKVRRFLAKPPAAAVMLRFVAAAEEGEAQAPLREWERAEVVPDIAEEILAMLDDHALEMGGHITALLTYVDTDGKTRGTLLLKRQANHVMADSAGDSLQTPESINSTLSGDTRAQSQQAQRHNEIMFRVYMSGMASNMAHSERMVQRMGDMVEVLASKLGSAERRVEAREREIEDLLELVRSMKVANDNAANDDGPPSAAQERAIKFLEMIAPAVLQRMMGVQIPPPPPRDAASGE